MGNYLIHKMRTYDVPDYRCLQTRPFNINKYGFGLTTAMSDFKNSRTVKVGDGTVTVKGWIQDTRNMGGISFIVLRDRYGTVQLTLPKKKIDPEVFSVLTKLPRESVVSVTGEVKESNQTELGLEIPSATEEQFAILRTSVNPVRMKNHPVKLDQETIDVLYRRILRHS